MKDPYVILGVERSASDEEIKKAYRDLARKYHPDNYVNNPLADLAQEKMKEINEAYDTITKSREAAGDNQAPYNYGTAGRSGHSAGPYKDARDAISSGDLNRAEMILGSITDRGAEWNFLMGCVAYRRGWMDNAARYFHTASAMEPGNMEYRQALLNIQNYGRQPFRGGTAAQGVDPCNICGNLILADCCCECMGGDLLSCC